MTRPGAKFEEANGGEVFLKINSAFNHLGKAEQQVATFIKNYPEEVTKLPINVLAEKVGVSVSTVVRLCQRIGIKGYANLKLDLAGDLAKNYEKTYAEIRTDDNLVSLMGKVEGLFLETIRNTFKLLSAEALKRAYQEVISAGSVLIVGTGGSAATAKLLNHKLLKLEINSQWSSDFTKIPLLINRMGEGDILFVISHSGSTNIVDEAIDMARDNNCSVIILTNYMQSPMAKKSDIILTTAVNEEPLGSEGGTTRIAQTSVIEILCLLIALKEQGLFEKESQLGLA